MIIVSGQLHLPPAQIADFAEAVAAMRPDVLAEAGCHHYSLLVEDAAAGIVNVTEYWDDDAALARHMTQPWIGAFFARFGQHIQASTVLVHEVAESRALPTP